MYKTYQNLKQVYIRIVNDFKNHLFVTVFHNIMKILLLFFVNNHIQFMI